MTPCNFASFSIFKTPKVSSVADAVAFAIRMFPLWDWGCVDVSDSAPRVHPAAEQTLELALAFRGWGALRSSLWEATYQAFLVSQMYYNVFSPAQILLCTIGTQFIA